MSEEEVIVEPPNEMEDEMSDSFIVGQCSTNMDNVAQGFVEGQFPAILPKEQVHLREDLAQDLLTWATQCEITQIQSFMNEKYRLYKTYLPNDAEKPESVLRAAWAVHT